MKTRNFYEREAVLEALEQYIDNSEAVEDELSPHQRDVLAAARRVFHRAELKLVTELGLTDDSTQFLNRFDSKWGNPRYV